MCWYNRSVCVGIIGLYVLNNRSVCVGTIGLCVLV